jgi:hypothetical protein
MDYRTVCLLKRDASGNFSENRLGSSHLVGLLLERCFRVLFAPARRALPKTLAALAAADLPDQVTFSDVLVPGEVEPGDVPVRAYPEDKALAVEMCRAVFQKLQGRPLSCQVHGVDLPSTVAEFAGSHDLLVSRFPGMESRLREGLHSVEVRCREVAVRQPQTFNWQDTLEGEALPLFRAETSLGGADLVGRILVFVEASKPCHSGPFQVHGALFDGQKQRWDDLFGWSGFKRQRDAAQPAPAPAPKAAPAAAPAPKAVPAPRRSREDEWNEVAAALQPSGGWVLITRFLKHPLVRKPTNQTKRYVTGELPCRWNRSTGGKPREGSDWKQMTVPGRGGGQGDGAVHCRVDFLKHVFMSQLRPG